MKGSSDSFTAASPYRRAPIQNKPRPVFTTEYWKSRCPPRNRSRIADRFRLSPTANRLRQKRSRQRRTRNRRRKKGDWDSPGDPSRLVQPSHRQGSIRRSEQRRLDCCRGQLPDLDSLFLDAPCRQGHHTTFFENSRVLLGACIRRRSSDANRNHDSYRSRDSDRCALRTTMRDHSIQANEIGVAVKDGVVTLTGTVDTYLRSGRPKRPPIG